jgi:hypothetical protein
MGSKMTADREKRFEPITDDEALDGNAAGGVLAAAFGADLTDAAGRCANCGTMSHVASLRLYLGGPGRVLRCPACSEVVIRILERADRVVVDLAGITILRFEASGPAA